MTVEYVYDGALSSRTVEWIESALNKYPYPVEVYTAQPPDTSTLTEHTYYKENDPGLDDYKVKGVSYMCFSVREDSDDSFYFFKTNEDRQLFITANVDQIIDVDPFKTRIIPKSSQSLKSRIDGVLYRVYGLLSPKRSSESTSNLQILPPPKNP